MTNFCHSLKSGAADTPSERGTVLDLTAQVLKGCRSPLKITDYEVN